MEGSRNIPSAPPPSGKPLTENTTPGVGQPGAGSAATPNVRPKMRGLEPGRTAGKRLRERKAIVQPEVISTTGMGKKNSPEALLRQRQEVLTAVSQLSEMSGKLKILAEAQRALESPDAPPKGLTMKVQIDDRMVSIIPPDQEALRGQDMETLLREVGEAINGGFAECKRALGPEPPQVQFQALQEKFVWLSGKLGKGHAKDEVMQGHLSQALKAVPASMEVDYSGGTVLIERVIKPKQQPPKPTPDQPPQPSQSVQPEG